jgi:lysophospholipase L1-like esterase
MNLRRKICSIFLLIAFGAVAAAQQPARDFALRDGDRVVFFGDSITEQRLYTTYIEHYVLTRYPDRRITFINVGWGGDKVTGNDCQPCAGVGGLARIKRDVIDRRPTVVTLLFGMNDGQYKDFDPAILKVYEDGLTAIIRTLKAQTQARIYVMTPTVYDGTRRPAWSHTDRYNEVLDRYSEAAKRIAAREGVPIIDLHEATTAALREAKQINASYTFVPDGVHPEADGQLLMAAEILRAWGAPPNGMELARSLTLSGDGSATLTLNAPLPWPSPIPSEEMRRTRPLIEEIGRVRLKLNGLPAGRYKVRVDDGDAVEYSAQELERGIPISALSKEAREATDKLAGLVRRRADLFFLRWRQIEVPLDGQYRSVSQVLSAFDALDAEITAQERTLAQPHQYRISITRLP